MYVRTEKMYTWGMDKAASELARKRWKKTTSEERSEVARKMNEAKYVAMSEEQRKAIGKRLAEARKKAKRRRKKT